MDNQFQERSRLGIGGRSPSGLDPEIAKQRKNQLSRISRLEAYYLKEKPLDWDKINGGDKNELERLETFQFKIRQVLTRLVDLGGIPNNHMNEYGGLLDDTTGIGKRTTDTAERTDSSAGLGDTYMEGIEVGNPDAGKGVYWDTGEVGHGA